MTSKRQKQKGWLLPDSIEPVAYTFLFMCVPDDPAYIAATRGALLELGRWWNWEKTYEEGDHRAADAAAVMYKLMVDTLQIGCSDMLRANPNNPCELQIRACGPNGGYVSLIDFSACINEAVSAITDAQTGDILRRLNELWDGNVSSVAPKLVYGDSDDVYRDLAQCIALGLLIQALAEGEIERRLKGRKWLDNLSDFFQSLAVALIAIEFPYAWIAALGSALVSAAIEVQDQWSNIQDIVLQDTDARQQVVCCMYQAMQGATPALVNFQAALDNCGFDPLSPSGVIANAVAPMLDDFNFYLAYLNFLQNIMPYAKSGLLDGSCLCDQWEHEFFAGHGGDEFWTGVANVSDGNALPIYDDISEKWDALPRAASPQFAIGVIETGEALNAFTLWEVEFHVEVAISPSEDRVQRLDAGLQMLVYPGDVPIASTTVSTTGNYVIQAQNIGQLAKKLFVRWSGGRNAAYARLTYVRVRGSGYDPFA